jgi:hypothetical protein
MERLERLELPPKLIKRCHNQRPTKALERLASGKSRSVGVGQLESVSWSRSVGVGQLAPFIALSVS